MTLEIDFAPYEAHFERLKDGNPIIKVFQKDFKLDELRAKAKEIAEPKNPVNDKKLVQKKGFSSTFVFGKNGKRRLVERIYETNIDAFLRKFPDVVPPAWFVESIGVESVVDHLLAFNVLDVPISSIKKAEKVEVVEDFNFSLSLPYIPPNYF